MLDVIFEVSPDWWQSLIYRVDCCCALLLSTTMLYIGYIPHVTYILYGSFKSTHQINKYFVDYQIEINQIPMTALVNNNARKANQQL